MSSVSDHYIEAERCLELAAETQGGFTVEAYWLQAALVHATLATAVDAAAELAVRQDRITEPVKVGGVGLLHDGTARYGQDKRAGAAY